MTTPDNDQPKEERDSDLVVGFVERASGLRFLYEEWIQLELKDCLPKAELLLPALGNGKIKRELKAMIRHMKAINRVELPDAVENIKGKCTELRQLVPDNIMEHRQELEGCLSRFVELVRELLAVRKFLDSQ